MGLKRKCHPSRMAFKETVRVRDLPFRQFGTFRWSEPQRQHYPSIRITESSPAFIRPSVLPDRFLPPRQTADKKGPFINRLLCLPLTTVRHGRRKAGRPETVSRKRMGRQSTTGLETMGNGVFMDETSINGSHIGDRG